MNSKAKCCLITYPRFLCRSSVDQQQVQWAISLQMRPEASLLKMLFAGWLSPFLYFSGLSSFSGASRRTGTVKNNSIHRESTPPLTTSSSLALPALANGTQASSYSSLVMSSKASRYVQMGTVRWICCCRNCSATANISPASTEVVPSS